MIDIESFPLGQIIQKGAESAPDKTAVADKKERKTYREMNDLSDALAAGLAELGILKGDRIAIYMRNSIELVTAFYALEKLGVIVAWVNPLYRQKEAEFILKNSEARGVFIFREWEGYDYLEAVSSIRDSLPNLEFILLAGKGDGTNVFEYKQLLARGNGRSYEPPSIDAKNDLAMLIYTSGTTGRPKGAMITHYQAVRAGMEYSYGINARSDDVFIGFLPMCHSYGCGAILIQPLLLQSTVVLMEKFAPESAFRIMEEEKVTIQLGAPVHYILELNNAVRENYDLTSLRAGMIAGQPAPEGLITKVKEEMGMYLTSFWGASEVGPGLGIICPYPSPLPIREKFIGKPIEGTEARIVDLATREELSDGEIGELTLKGWHVLKGYWRNPEETKKQIVDEWLSMGDLVSREENGYFKIYGRNKDLINRGGYKIYPYELESLIIDHIKVAQVCIVPTPNPVLGENICACIIPVENQTVTLQEIRDFMEEKIARNKLPNELCIMKNFPTLSGGVKIKKLGKTGLAELAKNDQNRETYRK
jgi:acyl-CoA synthetase (AMP-forming)/AMP-acid ligase II